MSNTTSATWTTSVVEELAQHYVRDMAALETRLFEEVHPALTNRGHVTREELFEIAAWKAARTRSWIARNDESDVVDITRAAFAGPERLRHRFLTLLHGVQVPMASAVLTVWRPDRYTVIDWRAVASLRRLELWDDALRPPPYPTYCDICRTEAARLRVSLRTLDRALWWADKTA